MKIVPASDVPAGPLRAFFACLPDGEQAFLKDDARDPETIAAWHRAGRAGRLAAVDSTGTVAARAPAASWPGRPCCRLSNWACRKSPSR
jgi:hypothetical protein